MDGKMAANALTIGLALLSQGQDARLFNDSDVKAVTAYWSQPGRYAKEPLKDPRGPWTVRLTPEGSLWLWNYNKARGLGKTNPEVTPGPQSVDEIDWEAWINAKVAYDRYQAAIKVSELNAKELGVTPDAPAGDSVDDPGLMPPGLLDLMGDPPDFAAAVRPTTYTVNFDDGLTLGYTDQVPVRPRYAYFRFPMGVSANGKKITESMNRLFKLAGLSDTERHVMSAVSPLEGGFDGINTYDTGFVSVGLIQFACLSSGGGSLGAVLQLEKAASPDAFRSDFHRFGVDVTDSGKLDCLDTDTGQEMQGPDAAKRIIDDKRLTAVFQRAGQMSDAFKVAQLQAARQMYYPADDKLTISLPDGALECRVGDIIRSEAGLATLMDRKVNTGNLGQLASVVQGVAQDSGAKTVDELASKEADIIASMSFRKDFLADASLSQPGGIARDTIIGSRHGDRKPKPAKPKSPRKPEPKPSSDEGSKPAKPQPDSSAGG